MLLVPQTTVKDKGYINKGKFTTMKNLVEEAIKWTTTFS